MIDVKYRPCFTERVTSPFGYRTSPINGKSEFHNGVDYSPADKIKYKHEPIIAPADGTVILAYISKEIGNNVQIDCGDGYVIRNFHLNDRVVEKGTRVSAGQLIGHMGSTGSSTAQHLHFEMRKNGKVIDPMPFIKGKPFEIGGEDLTRDEVKEIVNEILNGVNTKSSDWANTSIKDAIKNDISDGSRPQGYAKREEVIVMIDNLRKVIGKK